MSSTTAANSIPDAMTDAYLELDVGGMTCSACASAVERKLNKIDGVQASVNFATERALVTGLASEEINIALEAIAKAGYSAALRKPDDDAWTARAAEVRISSLRRRLAVAAILTIPLCDLTILLALVPGFRFPGWQALCVLLALPIVTWAAWPFHRATLRNLRTGSLSMDTLVSLGCLVSFGWAVYTLLFAPSVSPGYWLGFGVTPAGADSIYLDVAAGMITLQLGGRYFETRSRRRAGDVLNAIGNLAVKDARLLAGDGTECIVPSSQLRIGQSFVVLPGERVTTDGTVSFGRSSIDTSAMTGESIPAEVAAGSTVIGGTMNLNGRLVITADVVGAHTRLAQMAALADDAQRRKAKIQTLADRISAVFVPVVIVLASVISLLWLFGGAEPGKAISIGIAILIIACPCALGLATPTALMVGIGRGGQLGILIKGQDALEASGAIDTVVFDKTGTVTTGKMRVSGVTPLNGATEFDVLQLAGAIEAASEHPIGAAIADVALKHRPTLLPVVDFESLAGLGVRGTVGGVACLIGHARMLEELGLTLPAAVHSIIQALEDKGQTVVILAVGSELRGLIGVTDTVKPSAGPAVKGLHRLGLRTILLTGDSERSARIVGDAIGIDEVVARVLPNDKAAAIAALQTAGHRVAMVGDGVNDSVALATANLGLALVRGSDIAMKSADIILIREDLRVVVDAIQLSRKTLTTVRGNLIWAFGYNVIAIPIAALGLLNPLLAAGAMALSSLFVISNSLRLRNYEPMHTHSPASQTSHTGVLRDVE